MYKSERSRVGRNCDPGVFGVEASRCTYAIDEVA